MTRSKATATATQEQHPWRATVRTVIAATIALLPLLPSISEAAGISTVPIVVGILGVAAAATRVLAIPGFNAWLSKYKISQWLAAEPADKGK